MFLYLIPHFHSPLLNSIVLSGTLSCYFYHLSLYASYKLASSPRFLHIAMSSDSISLWKDPITTGAFLGFVRMYVGMSFEIAVANESGWTEVAVERKSDGVKTLVEL